MKLFNVINGLFAIFVSVYCFICSDAFFVKTVWMVGIMLLFIVLSWLVSFLLMRYLSKYHNRKRSPINIVNFVFCFFAVIVLFLANFIDISYDYLQLILFLGFTVWLNWDAILLFADMSDLSINTKNRAVIADILATFELASVLILTVFYITGVVSPNYVIACIIAVFGIRLIMSVAFIDISKIEENLQSD